MTWKLVDHCCKMGQHWSVCLNNEVFSCLLSVIILNIGLGRGVTAAMGRRKEALELERVWLRERKATALSLRNGFNILRRGFAKLD
jgi:hypothetical protein